MSISNAVLKNLYEKNISDTYDYFKWILRYMYVEILLKMNYAESLFMIWYNNNYMYYTLTIRYTIHCSIKCSTIKN